MKLFTKEMERKLQAQYRKGSDLEGQDVIAKIFNPFGKGTWYLINQDPEDPDYLWAIVDLMEVEIGSVSKKELEQTRVRFNLGLERDLYFEPMNAQKLYEGLKRGEHY